MPMPELSPLRDLIGSALPFDCFRPHFMRQALLGLLALAPMTAVMGIHVVNLRMAFFADAVSHSAFAGVALGLMLAWNPHGSTVLFALLIGLGVTVCQRRFALSVDSIIGVFFSGVVAFGLAAASRDRHVARNAQAFLFGDILTLGDGEIWLMLFALAAVALFQLIGHNRMVYLGLNPALARTHGVRTGIYQYLFAGLLSLVAIFAVWTVGVFLVTALLVVPAAAARNLARSAGGMFWWAAGISVAASVTGLVVSAQPWAGTATGPTVVLAALACFIFSALASALGERGGE